MQRLTTLLVTTCLILISSGSIAQTQVNMKINHMLGTDPFAFNTAYQNDIAVDFNISRLQYYISSISLTHDGGTVTPISDTWVLVNASMPTTVDLGSHSITNLESIKFYIGVESTHNHLDPTSWPVGHPLAPVSPSMHWGWSAGYRFIAMEGKGGSSLSNLYELHGLWDANYFSVDLSTSGDMVGGDLEINIDADYTQALNGIDVSSGKIRHGDNLEDRELLVNFSSRVFKAGSATTSIRDKKLVPNAISIAPNPAVGQRTTIAFNPGINGNLHVTVFDIVGRKVVVTSSSQHNGAFDLTLPNAGIYMVQVSEQGMLRSTHKLIAY